MAASFASPKIRGIPRTNVLTRPDGFPAYRTSAKAQSVGLEHLQRIAVEQASIYVTAPLRLTPLRPPMPSVGVRNNTSSAWLDFRQRAFVLTAMTVTIGALYLIQRTAWPTNTVLPGPVSAAWSWASLVWLAPLIPAACELAGLLIYEHPRWPRADKAIPQLVSWRIVSRGINKEALTATILRCRAESRGLPLFSYVIEVVTDTSHDGLPAPARDLHYIHVPRGYRTLGGTKAKARALNYALHASPLPDNAWIVHLDEETQPTPSGIRGIARAIAEEERTCPFTGSLSRDT